MDDYTEIDSGMVPPGVRWHEADQAEAAAANRRREQQ
jgi:hypothetical protein